MSHFERAVALKPDLFGAYENLGKAYMATGDVGSAVHAAGRALELRETVAGKMFFAQCVNTAGSLPTMAGFANWCCARFRKAGRTRASWSRCASV